MKMTADESAAVALAFAALRARATMPVNASPRASRWTTQAPSEADLFGGASRADRNGFSAWTAAARLEALRDDV